MLTQLIDAPGAKPDWRLYYLRASAYEEIGDPAKTQADLTAALKLDPDEPELLNFQGYFWIERGENLKEALAHDRSAPSRPSRSPARSSTASAGPTTGSATTRARSRSWRRR